MLSYNSKLRLFYDCISLFLRIVKPYDLKHYFYKYLKTKYKNES